VTRLADVAGVVPGPQTGRADRWIGRAVTGTVVGLAGIAGAISYSHMRQLAASHGQTGWHAHAFPLSVDGIEIVASLILFADRRGGRRSGWLPWAAPAIGTAGSLTANIAAAGPDPVSRVIAGWPALALLIAVKLLSAMFDHNRSLRVSSPSHHPDPVPADTGTSPSPGSATSRVPRSPAPVMAAVLPETPSHLQGSGGDRADVSARTVPDIAGLLPAARVARERLASEGRMLTRDALGAWLRENGHPVGNTRLTPLLRALRDEAEAA
jgi:hypothetical protein